MRLVQQKFFGISVAFDGTVVDFDQFGVAEIEDADYAKIELQLAEHGASNMPEAVSTDGNTEDPIKKELMLKNLKDLAAMCVELGFPEEEYKPLKKIDLVDYIIKNSEEPA